MNLESYPSNYLDINFLANILYNAVYSKQVTEFLPDINYKNIDINDFKLSNLSIAQQTGLINSMFNTNIEFYQRISNVYFLKRSHGALNTNISLYSYIDDKDDVTDYENANSLISWILSDLVIKGITNGILLNIMTVDIKKSLLNMFFEKYPELNAFEDKDNNSYIRCVVSERFFKMQSLSQIIPVLNEKQVNNIVFQVLITLAIIQNVYPTFRHNNLSLENIYVYEKVAKNKTVILNNNTVEYNDMGYEIKITGFTKSIIGGITDNNALLPDQKELNHYEDVKTFLNCIEKNSKFKYLNKIKKYNNNKNFMLSDIIMSTYLDLGTGNIVTANQDGGAKSKKKGRVYKSIRYLNNDVNTYAPSNYSKNTLPDNLSDSDSDSMGDYRGVNSAHSQQMNQYTPEMPSMAMPHDMAMPHGMQMPQGIPMSQAMPLQMPQGMPMSSMQMPGAPGSAMQMPVQLQGMQQQPQPTGSYTMQGGEQTGGHRKSYIDMSTMEPKFFF